MLYEHKRTENVLTLHIPDDLTGHDRWLDVTITPNGVMVLDLVTGRGTILGSKATSHTQLAGRLAALHEGERATIGFPGRPKILVTAIDDHTCEIAWIDATGQESGVMLLTMTDLTRLLQKAGGYIDKPEPRFVVFVMDPAEVEAASAC